MDLLGLSALIPISLNVTMEVVKVFHARYINWDTQMVYYDPIVKKYMPAIQGSGQSPGHRLREPLANSSYPTSKVAVEKRMAGREPLTLCEVAGTLFAPLFSQSWLQYPSLPTP